VRAGSSVSRVVDRSSGFTKPPVPLSPLHAQADNAESPKALIDGHDRSYHALAVTALPPLAPTLAAAAAADPRDLSQGPPDIGEPEA
jgi:hypothetical protein